MREEFYVAPSVIVAFDKVHDGFGFLRDTCEVIKTDEKGHRTIYPTHPPIKVTTQTKDQPLITHSAVLFSMDDAIWVYERLKQEL